MRTTVDLPDTLFRELKAVAAKRGLSIKQVLRDAVEVEIRKGGNETASRVSFPLLPSSEPGSLVLTNADIEELLT